MVTGITLHGRNKAKTLTFTRIGKTLCITTNDDNGRSTYKVSTEKIRSVMDHRGHFMNLASPGAENLLVMHKQDEIIFRNDHSYWSTLIAEMDRIMEHLVLPFGDACREKFERN